MLFTVTKVLLFKMNNPPYPYIKCHISNILLQCYFYADHLLKAKRLNSKQDLIAACDEGQL